MKSLELQFKEDQDITDIVPEILKLLSIDERGGGPEGLYYTSELCEGEYLYRNIPILIEELIAIGHIKKRIRY